MNLRTLIIGWSALALLSLSPPLHAQQSPGTDVAVLRNTVVNLLQAMVKQGLISKESAEKLVADAQSEAAAEVAASSAGGDAAAPGDVRVTYVPQVVQEQITAQVKQDVQASVVADVKKAAQEEGWGVPAALPAWVRNARWSSEIRVRSDTTIFSDANQEFSYLNFQAINDDGGIGAAGSNAFLNTTQNQTRFQLRVNVGGLFDLGPNALAGIKFGTGNEANPVTRNQALGNYNETFPVLLEEAYIRLGTSPDQAHNEVLFWAGRTPNPFQSTELVWDNDVRFNGFTVQYAWNPGLRSAISPGGPRLARGPFASVGAYPVQDIALTSDDKWLVAGQLGYEFDATDDLRLSFATAYYDYQNITGKRNAPDSTLLNYTAPEWVQKGNTMFDILNDNNPETELFALAADYKLLDFTAIGTLALRPDLVMEFIGNYVTNLGYDEDEIQARTGVLVPARVDAYRLEFRVGAPDLRRPAAWRAFLNYNYVERDAVLDAFNDSDFHRGGTDAQGYVLGGEMGITSNISARLRYLSADEIDGPPLGIDIVELDLNAKF